MTIFDYTPTLRPQFTNLLSAYFRELDSDIPEDILRGKLADLIEDQHNKKIIRVSIAVHNGIPAGFSIFQIDTPESDWCKRLGWGFIREFYIIPEARHQGYGSRLAAHTEQCLRKIGAQKLYLTSDPAAIAFWQRCGWRLTEEICSNDLNILEK